MAAGTRLLPKRALLHLRDLCLHPQGSTVKKRLSGCEVSCAIVLQSSSEKLNLGRPVVFAAVLVMYDLVRALTFAGNTSEDCVFLKQNIHVNDFIN